MLTPDVEQAKRFLDALYGGFPGEQIEFRLIHGKGRDGVRPIRKFATLPVGDDIFAGLARANNDAYNVYFGVATRRNGKPWFVPAIWTDIDFKDSKPRLLDAESFTRLQLMSESLKPSIVVKSGHGIHAYWLVSAGPEDHSQVQELNRKVAKRLHGDAVFDLARVMRLPGFFNVKDIENPQLCQVANELTLGNMQVYDLYQLESWLNETVVSVLDKNTEQLIRFGNQGQYHSRSEADFAVALSMVRSGFSDDEIREAFRTGGIGQKYREKGAQGRDYLERTIRAARQRAKEE